MKTPEHSMRRVKSYVRRQTRMSKLQIRSLEELSSKYCIPFEEHKDDSGDPRRFFPHRRDAPVVLEIGFGMGYATTAIARANPDVSYLGVEVHRPGVGKLMSMIEDEGLQNLRIINHDVVEVLEHMIGPASLDGVHVFFPDPWPKKRHHKRRLLQSDFVSLLASRMKEQAILHVATDWEEYAGEILACLDAEGALENVSGPGRYAERPHWRPETAFERKGLNARRVIYELLFSRRPA